MVEYKYKLISMILIQTVLLWYEVFTHTPNVIDFELYDVCNVV